MSALLPCPWCGGPAAIMANGMIHCDRVRSNCIGASVHFVVVGTREDTIAAWNTRATPAPAVGDGRDAWLQALTDPENQPSQWGTIPLSMLPKPMELPYGDGPMDNPTDYDEFEDQGYARGWNACLAAIAQGNRHE